MSRSSNSLATLAAMALAACGSGAGPVQSSGSSLSMGGNDYALPVRSMVERRFLTVVRQQYDFSCGSAALATLLRYHYGEAQNEQSIFIGMWRDGDQEQIRRSGFSLLDMKRYLNARGLAADGYQVSLRQVAEAGIPGIVLINMSGFKHFVVVKGIERGQVLIGDPSLGIRLIKAPEFQRMWNGIIFVLNGETDRAKTSFGRADEWALVGRAPYTQLMEPVSLQALALTRPQAFPPEL